MYVLQVTKFRPVRIRRLAGGGSGYCGVPLYYDLGLSDLQKKSLRSCEVCVSMLCGPCFRLHSSSRS